MENSIDSTSHAERSWESKKMGADYSTIFERRGTLMRKIAEVYHGDNDPEGIADVHLITAAPKLLRAAEATLALLQTSVTS